MDSNKNIESIYFPSSSNPVVKDPINVVLPDSATPITTTRDSIQERQESKDL